MRKFTIKNMGKTFKIFNKILDFIYPFDIRCSVCNKEIVNGNGTGICHSCNSKINVIDKDNVVKMYGDTAVYSYALYGNLARDIILDEKDDDKPYLIKSVARYLNKLIIDFDIKADLIVFVPSSKTNLKTRGYEHTKILAAELSLLTNIPYSKGLKRLKESEDQTKVDTTERESNVKDCFVFEGNIEGKTIILVDDLITSGATIGECVSVVKIKNPKKIIGLTFARAKL